MEINQLLQMGVDLIKDRPYGDPALESILLLGKLLDVDKIHIYTHGKEKVSDAIVNKFLKLMKKRSKGYPIQYLLNSKEFMGLDFYIEEGVLIPRDDTEILVEYVLKFIEQKYKDIIIRVLDLGMGSGAIALSIAYHCKNAVVYGVEIDEIPLKIAHFNKERFRLTNVSIFKGDLFEGIRNMKEKFHIIVSNPPYIPRDELSMLQAEVKQEPMKALDGGKDGLKFYRRIIPESKKYLMGRGLLALEIGYNQGANVKNIMKEEGFKGVRILKDLQKLDRVVVGTFE